MPLRNSERAATYRTRRSRRLVLEPLEDRIVLSNPPFAVGGDPSVNPADFRVTTFASGLNYPHGMIDALRRLAARGGQQSRGHLVFQQLGRACSDSSTPTATESPTAPGRSSINGLPGEVTALQQAGDFILATSSAGRQRANLASSAPVATPGASLTLVGSINFSFPGNWEHTTYASVVRPTPGQPGDFDVIFNIGSQVQRGRHRQQRKRRPRRAAETRPISRRPAP